MAKTLYSCCWCRGIDVTISNRARRDEAIAGAFEVVCTGCKEVRFSTSLDNKSDIALWKLLNLVGHQGRGHAYG